MRKLNIGKAWRVTLVIAKWTAGLAFALVLLVVGINCFDEDLTPEAKALLLAPPNAYKPEENIYLALMGFDAPPGVSPLAAGQAKVMRLDAAVSAYSKDRRTFSPNLLKPAINRLEFEGEIDFCEPLRNSCLAGLDTHRTQINCLLRRNRELFRRYKNLHLMKGYYETATLSVYSVLLTTPGKVRQLFLADIALRSTSGSRAQQSLAISDLHNDIVTWRQMLTGTGAFLSKIFAFAYLRNDYALLAEIVSERRFSFEALSPQVLRAIEVVDDSAWANGNVFEAEYRWASVILKPMQGVEPDSLLAQPANGLNWYSPRSWRVDKTVFDFKRSSPVLFFCAVIPRGLATGIGTGRAEQIYLSSLPRRISMQ